MRSSSRKFKRRICGSGYCTGKHDCNLPNNRSKLGGYSYCTGQCTQKHGDFHHESLHTEHDQRKHDQLRRQDTIFFFYGAAAARFCTCSRSSLPPPARARLPEPHSTCYPQPREWLCMSMLAHEHAGPPLFEHGARAALWSSQVSSDTVLVLGPVWRRISDYRIDARTLKRSARGARHSTSIAKVGFRARCNIV